MSGTSGILWFEILMQGVSEAGGVDLRWQLGDSGGIETGSYISTDVRVDASPNVASSTAGFETSTSGAGDIVSGIVFGRLIDTSNTWIVSGVYKYATAGVIVMAGEKSLSGALTQVTISGGTFDAGAINAHWGT